MSNLPTYASKINNSQYEENISQSRIVEYQKLFLGRIIYHFIFKEKISWACWLPTKWNVNRCERFFDSEHFQNQQRTLTEIFQRL